MTLWELFTYGKRPYESTLARNMAEVLDRGERLPQPSICTIDVYMVMIQCESDISIVCSALFLNHFVAQDIILLTYLLHFRYRFLQVIPALLFSGWMVDAEARPSFSELEMEFTTMSKDPGRYLVVTVGLVDP